MSHKLSWNGTVISVQPRIRLLRSFDARSHSYLGYVLTVNGQIAGEEKQFRIAIGQAAQAKHTFQVDDVIQGKAEPVADPRLEVADYYKVSALKVLARGEDNGPTPPPWHGVTPPLEVYRERGHRRLSASTYQNKCTSCIWGCRMPVEMVIDHWKGTTRYRFETFCYGPKSCPAYRPGPTRKVPGRKGMSWEEEDWVDEQDTAHRDDDE